MPYTCVFYMFLADDVDIKNKILKMTLNHHRFIGIFLSASSIFDSLVLKTK